MATTTKPQPLNELQRSLVGLFSRGMSEQEQNAVREILLGYYDQMLQNEVGQAIQQKGYTSKDFDNVLNTSQRTKR